MYRPARVDTFHFLSGPYQLGRPPGLPVIATALRWRPLKIIGENALMAGTGEREFRSRQTIFEAASGSLPYHDMRCDDFCETSPEDEESNQFNGR
ncbi:hypothetical protein DSCA_12980 [Desulfosarcina alkanivorans]|uniref:Uncharacterized protein n=1 Tax=Desulfosarcina alkanivorans TaxID=571177 RepID=A0A5K7YE71_9BACT|nr:hypothetical protein DSCA_12980 [Desulfosarcina alkanivorans]